MKKLLTTLILLICVFFTYDLFKEKIENQKIQEISSRAEYEEFLAKHPFNNRKINLEEWENTLKADRPDLAWEQDYLATMNPATGRPEQEKLTPVREMTKAMMLAPLSGIPGGSGPGESWVERGPNNVGGRTRALVWDPNTTNKVWAGGVTGGLWYNNDITSDGTWTKVDDFWDAIAISSISFDPNNSSIMYVGTGEGFGTGSSRGAGIWKSTNGGTTWSQLGSTTDFYYINDLVVNNSGVYAAVGREYYNGTYHGSGQGLQRSIDGGSTWTQVMPSVGSGPAVPADIEIAADGEIWVGTRQNSFNEGGGRVYSSTNGTTWTLDYTHTSAGRVELACAPTDEKYVYAIFEVGKAVDAIKRTTNDGTDWVSLLEPSDADTGIPNSDFTRGQAWYDLIIQVDPNNKEVVITGGIDLFRTDNGGVSSWSQLSHWYGGFGYTNVHADQHQIMFKPGSSSTAVFGNDGGVYYSSNLNIATPSFTAKNNGYNVTQFYSCAIHPDSGSNIFLAGAQDNGTQLYSSAGINSTTSPIGGDGAYCHFLQTNGNYAIGSYVYNNYYPSINAGTTFSNSAIGGTDNSGSFINQSDFHDALAIQYSVKTNTSLKKITNINSTTPVSSDVSLPSSTGATVTHIRSSEYTAATSTLFLGTSAGGLFKVENADGGTPTMISISGGSLPNGSISCVDLGSNENELIVTLSNYGVNSVWYSINGGTSWTSKEGDLPDMPVRWVLMNPTSNQEVILATEVGVWATTNFQSASPNWTASNTGLANVRVDMLKHRTSDNVLIAATHGRGLFSSSFTPVTCQAPSALTATSITGTTANLGWTEAGTATNWDIEWGASGFTPTGTPTITGTTSNPNNLTGLTRGTAYSFYVRANCGGGDLSTWSGPYTFTTPQVSTFPFTETFEDASATRSFWTQVNKTAAPAGSSDWTYAAGSYNGANGGSINSAHGGSKNARFVSVGYVGTPITSLISPLLDLSSLTAPQLKFYYGQEVDQGYQNKTKVYWSANSGETWNEIAYYEASVSSWTAVTLALPNKSATYMIAFEGINGYGYANVIDDVVIEESASTWTGATDNDWNTTSNWSLSSLPLTTDDIIIPSGLTNYPTATSAVTFNSLTINSGASMIAQSTVNGDVTYNLAIPDTNWHLVSSPVVGETYDDAWIAANAIASGTGNNRGISTYNNGTPDATTKHWRYSQVGSTATFTAGGGYANLRTASGNYSFTGAYPTTDVTPAISQNDKKDNLIGNPYPSYLDIGAFITANTANMTSTHQAVYVWNGTAYTNLTTGYIHPGQAFFMNSNVASGTASITEAMQSHNTGSFYRTNNPTINLTLSNGVSSKETTINYLEGKTIGLDPRFDIGMFKGVASDLSVFTHLIEGHQEVAFETQALPNTDLESVIVPVGVKANANEEITFSLNAFNFAADLKIFLEDSVTNTYTRLDEANSTYKITTTEALNGIGRFYLHTSRSSLSVDEVVGLENVSIYKTDARTLRIAGLQNNSNTNVTLFNLTGKQVFNTSFKSNGVKDIAVPKLATGVYVVKLKTDTGMFSKKIILE
jgi:hypothetical protein